MNESEKSKNTQQFLRCISQHLSSRQECKGISYRIAIGCDDEIASPHQVSMFEGELANKRVCFYPNIFVFPDLHHRKATDKVNIVAHVALMHFDKLLLSYQEEGCTFVDTDKLVPGVYEYQSSIDHKKRRWIRVEK